MPHSSFAALVRTAANLSGKKRPRLAGRLKKLSPERVLVRSSPPHERQRSVESRVDAPQNRQVSPHSATGDSRFSPALTRLWPGFPSAFLFDTPSVGNPHPAGLRLSGVFQTGRIPKEGLQNKIRAAACVSRCGAGRNAIPCAINVGVTGTQPVSAGPRNPLWTTDGRAYSGTIPMVLSQISTSAGHPVIGRLVRRSPKAWLPCAYRCISAGTPAFWSAM